MYLERENEIYISDLYLRHAQLLYLFQFSLLRTRCSSHPDGFSRDDGLSILALCRAEKGTSRSFESRELSIEVSSNRGIAFPWSFINFDVSGERIIDYFFFPRAELQVLNIKRSENLTFTVILPRSEQSFDNEG